MYSMICTNLTKNITNIPWTQNENGQTWQGLFFARIYSTTKQIFERKHNIPSQKTNAKLFVLLARQPEFKSDSRPFEKTILFLR